MKNPDTSGLRLVYGAVLVLVIAAFLLSLREILNPFVLFVLLVMLISPFAGSRTYVLLVSTAGILTGIWLLQTTGFLLAPFFLALLFAYVLHPAVEGVEGRRVMRWRISRDVSIVLLSIPLIGLLALLIFVAIPALSAQIAGFIQTLPALIESAVAWGEATVLELSRRDIPFIDEDELLASLAQVRPEEVLNYLQQHQQAVASRVWGAVMGAGRGIGAVLTIFGYLVLTPVLIFYLLRDWDKLTDRMAGLVPRPRRERIVGFFELYDNLLSRYLRGQVLAASIVGLLTTIGLWIVGFPYALLIGVTAGVFNLVPYLGLIVSLIPALIIAIFSGAFLTSLLKIAIVFGIVQALDGSVIGPRVVGDSVGLHPVWVILALAVFGFFFGFVGLLLAIPLAVLVKLLLTVLLDGYRRSAFFLGADG